MTNQEMFDIVWTKYVIEGQPSAYNGHGCEYRTTDGRRCAIGWCLSEEELDHIYAQKTIHWGMGTMDKPLSTCTANIVIREMGLDMNPIFANKLQYIHDLFASNPRFNKEVEEGLRGFALQYNLTIPEV